MTLQRINLRTVGVALFALALAVGLVTRPVFVFRTTDYQTDQAIDSFVYQEMRQGNLPTLGPRSSIGAYSMPPLYYYLVFPFTLGSTNPAWQALPNALFSFLTIPQLGLLLWLLLERRGAHVRVFLAGLGAFWWSMLAGEIRLANVEWSPTLIPFFLIAAALLFRIALRSCGRQHILLWCGFGGALAVMSNLHSTALFALPLLFLACVGYALTSRHDWKGPLVAFLTILTLFLPYIIGEMRHGFTNTLAIYHTVLEPTGAHTLMAHVDRAVFNYHELWQLLYAPFGTFASFGTLLFGACALLALLSVRAERSLAFFLVMTFVIASIEASNFWTAFFLHYKALLWIAPLLAVILSLSLLERRSLRSCVVAGVLLLGIAVSLWQNGIVAMNLANAKFGATRLPTASDTANALKAIPTGATVCSKEPIVLSYLATVEKRTDVVIAGPCEDGAYALVPHCTTNDGFKSPIDCAYGIPDGTQETQRLTTISVVRYGH